MKDLQANAPTHCIIGLCGNKVDLNNDLSVSFEDLTTFATQHGIKHYKESSAKTNVGITEIFEKLVTELEDNKEKIIELTDAFTRKTF